MSRDSLREFAVGESDAAGRHMLRSARLSKHLLLLRRLLEVVPEQDARAARLSAGMDLLASLDPADPDGYQYVLAYPHVGAWLSYCLREAGKNARWLDFAHLGAVAAAAAIRANVDFEVPVPVRSGQVHLPTLGVADVDVEDQLVMACGDAGRHWIEAGSVMVKLPPNPHEDRDGWYGLRVLSGSPVVLDDVDPYRPAAKLGFTGRLSAAQAREWNQAFGKARESLLRSNANMWEDVTALLASIVPLRRGSDGNGVSTTSRDAFGCFAATLPRNAEAFAATVVHEVQHNKLTALHTLIPLVNEDRAELHYSPWRSDPRPAYGLLHGCYAFTGVADFWRARTGNGPLATFQYLRAALQVRVAVRALASSVDLTEAGRELVTALKSKVDSWRIGDLSDDIRSAVDDVMLDHRITWCLANRAIRDEDVAALADLWLAGREPRSLPESLLATTAPENFEAGTRVRLATARLAGRTEFEAAKVCQGAADIAVAERDYATARQLFEAEVVAGGTAAWSGLALVASRTGGAEMWRERPELVRALYMRLSEVLADLPTPDAVARWLGSGG